MIELCSYRLQPGRCSHCPAGTSLSRFRLQDLYDSFHSLLLTDGLGNACQGDKQ